MFSFLIAFFIALVVSGCIIFLAKRYPSILDSELTGVQKMHKIPVPRIGGLAIYSSTLISVVAIYWRGSVVAHDMLLLVLCALPAFTGGFLEDYIKRISPKWRTFFMCITFMCAYFFLGLLIHRVDIPLIDTWLVAWSNIPAMFLTIFALLAITNAVNIIDGYNGLAAMVSILILLALSIVAFQVGDSYVLSSSLVIVGAICGFLVWNFPFGKIFLGDGGAYFLGSVIGMLVILLVMRNPTVSAWFALLVLAYPLFEVAFSIYRKVLVRGTSASQPDTFHLHQLIYKRLSPCESKYRNAYTAPYLWILSSMAIVPAVLFYDQTLILAPCFLLFCLSYVVIYKSIVRWRTPKILGKISQR